MAALAVAVAVFFGALWVFGWVRWSWLPHQEADRWVVAAGFATVVSASVFGVLMAWAESGSGDVGGAQVRVSQKARAWRRGRVDQSVVTRLGSEQDGSDGR